MPRKPCYWTRKLELDLIEFVRHRDFIWKNIGNSNYHIERKYKAYAEFARILGRGFTARSVRDRWVNIRSTFNHNLRRVNKSTTEADVYVPCWPLWRPMQFLRNATEENVCEDYSQLQTDFQDLTSNTQIKEENATETNDCDLQIRQRGYRTNRPREKPVFQKSKNKCKRVINDLVKAMNPLANLPCSRTRGQNYWFFGKHVTERLNNMREIDAVCANREILKILEEFEASESEIPEG